MGRPLGCWIWFQFSVHTEDSGWLLFLWVYPLINTPLLYSILGYFGTLLYANKLFSTIKSPQREPCKRSRRKWDEFFFCLFVPGIKKKITFMKPWSSSWQMGLYISIVLSTNSLHFKRKLKKVVRRQCYLSHVVTLIQKIVFWLAAWLATHVTLNSTTNPESAL